HRRGIAAAGRAFSGAWRWEERTARRAGGDVASWKATCSKFANALHLPSPGGGGSARMERSEMRDGWGDLSACEMSMVSTSIRRAAAKRLRANTTPHERIL